MNDVIDRLMQEVADLELRLAHREEQLSLYGGALQAQFDLKNIMLVALQHADNVLSEEYSDDGLVRKDIRDAIARAAAAKEEARRMPVCLIDAAPELLDALREVVRISDRKHIAWDAAKAAIAKAEGRKP